MDALLRLFEARFGRPPAFLRPVVADGSRRRMVRMSAAEDAAAPGAPPVAIGVLGPEPEENRAFLAFSATFRGLGLPVPEVYGADEREGVYLVEDLGDTTLFQALTAARLTDAAAGSPAPFPASMEPVYRRVLEWLPRFQVEGGRAIDFALAHPHEAFDRTSMLWDLNYFKYHFLKLADVPFHERRLEDDFERLVAFLLTADARHFLYRDFQSRNVMLRAAEKAGGAGAGGSGGARSSPRTDERSARSLPRTDERSARSLPRTDERSAGMLPRTDERSAGEPWFLDYQGGRRGALAYDVASLLYDAKAEIPPQLRDALLEHYLDALERHAAVDRARFHEQFRGFVLIRIMQALGAYGYRGFYERKPHFLASVPPAVRNVGHLLASGPLPVAMPELRAVFERIVASERFARIGAAGLGGGPGAAALPELGLTVNVCSFSYRRGLPVDPGGNGGGFVFDCRGLENPQADPALAGLCGRDLEVEAALDAQPAAAAFLGHARALIEAQVATYLRRDWTALSVAFGCTGGQHRSVYLAERLAADLRARFPKVRVTLEHAERTRWPATAGRE